MENTESKVGTGKVILTIILTFIITSAIFILGYKLFFKDNNEINKSEQNEESSNLNIIYEAEVMSADERYDLYIKGLAKSIKKLENDVVTFDGDKIYSYFSINNDRHNYTGISDLVIEYNKAYLTLKKDSNLANQYGESYNIEDNVVKGGIVPVGNGGGAVLIWYITSDGKLYNTSVSADDKTINFKENKKLKNIVDITQIFGFDAAEAIAIDIDGNTYKNF